MNTEQYKSLELLDKYFKETPKEEIETEINLISKLKIKGFALSIYDSSIQLPSIKDRSSEIEKQVNTKCEDYRIDKNGFRQGFIAAYNWLNREIKKQR